MNLELSKEPTTSGFGGITIISLNNNEPITSDNGVVTYAWISSAIPEGCFLARDEKKHEEKK